ncbi:DNA-binding response regulator, partial [Staphylococcus simulans]
MAKVILIDDHHIVRQGLEFLLSTVADLEVLASLSDGQSLINYLNEHDIPD